MISTIRDYTDYLQELCFEIKTGVLWQPSQLSSCARGDTICFRPLQVDSILIFIHKVAPVPACWLFKTSAFGEINILLLLQQQADLRPFDLESGVRVTWATSVPILVFLGLSVLELDPMYATDRRQTKASLNASALWRRRHNNECM